MDIVNVLKIPRSHVYGEPRYGRPRGRQLEVLIQSGLAESRIFPGERGRGKVPAGQIYATVMAD